MSRQSIINLFSSSTTNISVTSNAFEETVNEIECIRELFESIIESMKDYLKAEESFYHDTGLIRSFLSTIFPSDDVEELEDYMTQNKIIAAVKDKVVKLPERSPMSVALTNWLNFIKVTNGVRERKYNFLHTKFLPSIEKFYEKEVIGFLNNYTNLKEFQKHIKDSNDNTKIREFEKSILKVQAMGADLLLGDNSRIPLQYIRELMKMEADSYKEILNKAEEILTKIEDITQLAARKSMFNRNVHQTIPEVSEGSETDKSKSESDKSKPLKESKGSFSDPNFIDLDVLPPSEEVRVPSIVMQQETDENLNKLECEEDTTAAKEQTIEGKVEDGATVQDNEVESTPQPEVTDEPQIKDKPKVSDDPEVINELEAEGKPKVEDNEPVLNTEKLEESEQIEETKIETPNLNTEKPEESEIEAPKLNIEKPEESEQIEETENETPKLNTEKPEGSDIESPTSPIKRDSPLLELNELPPPSRQTRLSIEMYLTNELHITDEDNNEEDEDNEQSHEDLGASQKLHGPTSIIAEAQ